MTTHDKTESIALAKSHTVIELRLVARLLELLNDNTDTVVFEGNLKVSSANHGLELGTMQRMELSTCDSWQYIPTAEIDPA